MLETGPRTTVTSCSISGSIQKTLCVPWSERWKLLRAPSTITATRPKSCRPRMLMLVCVRRESACASTPGMPKKMS